MSSTQSVCIIVGASHAGAQLAFSLRREGWAGAILLIGDESGLPYQRPPLSKAALKAAEAVQALPIYSAAAYEKAGITCMLGVRVVAVDRQCKRVLLANGEALDYDKLALCTGARARQLALPGRALAGVHDLRTAADARAIAAQVHPGGRAVIVGAGYIGLETAATLRGMGMQVTVLEQGGRVLERVVAPETSAYFERMHAAYGVDIRKNIQAREFLGAGRIAQVLCSDGTLLAADLVVLGVGVVPDMALAQEAGLVVGEGILVDEFAQTSDPDIVAAGDCTFHPNALLGFSLRLESVPNAVEQARSAAASVCGARKAYCAMPWFWSDQYDSHLQIAGLNRGHERVVVQADDSDSELVVWYIKDERVVAADCINSPKQFMRAKKLVANQAPVAELLSKSAVVV
ncbi:NAD(P)/FAD-dependent oxidoreductase [Variovorax boronicumulans]|uniref:NAD(P)/FAD-dependent oxidoreductase n=1 Tax=Variovorax boronicumulans TaxID=436515 RepID=UPI0036F383BB